MFSWVKRALAAPPWCHAVALFIMLLALLPFSRTDTVFFADEGSALAQAEQLSDGEGWTRPLSFPASDPDAESFPLFAGDVSGDRLVPLGHHAVYALVLDGWYAAGGQPGAVVLSLAGCALAAYLTARIVRRLRPGLEVAALWAVGAASPLFFDGYLVVAHTLVAALAAGVVLALLRCLDGEHRPAMIGIAGALTFGAGVLRNEALLFGAALAIAVFFFGIRSRDRWLTAFAIVVGGAVAAARVGEAMIRSRVIGGSGAHQFTVAMEGGSWIGDRLTGAFITLLLPSYGQFGAGDVALVLGVTCALVAAVIARRRPDDRNGLLLFSALAVGLLGLRLVLAPGPVPGLLWACPVLGVGAVLVTRDVLRNRATALLAAVVVLFAGAVLLTQYANGGGREWGWRYFSLALPVAVAIAVIAIVDGAARLASHDGRVAARLLVAVCALATVLGFLALRTTKDDNRQIVDGIRDVYEATPAADGGKPVVVTTQWGTIDRFNWDRVDDTRWLVIAPTNRSQVSVYLERIAGLGVGQLTFVTTNVEDDRPFVTAQGDVIAERSLPDDHHVLTVRLRRP
jgi:MFS family permease